MALFQDSKFSSHKKLLFILSDGDPTDGKITEKGIKGMISKFTEADVTVVSCFITPRSLTQNDCSAKRNLTGIGSQSSCSH